MSAATHLLKLLVGEMFDQLEQLGVLAEEVFADVTTGHRRVLLVLAVDDFIHAFGQQTGCVTSQQFVPIPAPDNLDHVPAGTVEDRFEFLNDLAVAADRTVESLQVAVDDEDQVVELLARRQADRAERFWFVAFAVAQKRPDFLALGIFETAIVRGTR